MDTPPAQRPSTLSSSEPSTRDDDLPSSLAAEGRESDETIARQMGLIAQVPFVQRLINALPNAIAIVNSRRQVVAANRAMVALGWADMAAAAGKRPGEIIGCEHADAGEDGCGTSVHCSRCGALRAVLDSVLTGEQSTQETRLRLGPPSCEALDLMVTATPIEVHGEQFTVCVLEDISDRKRLAVLSRAFFHDVLNTVGAIQGYANLISRKRSDPKLAESLVERLAMLSRELMEEIQSHRDLLYAESGDLAVDVGPVVPAALLGRLVESVAQHPCAADRHLKLANTWHGSLITDARLLMRILVNMVKNALEATDSGGTAVIGCTDRGDEVEFSVHNASYIPPDVQIQVFQRSFSTKGQPGRGIGTHSMKLLGERYLHGRVYFRTSETEGTTFAVALPKAFPAVPSCPDSDPFAGPQDA